nr:MAG TPA: hypothetical protein [Inoviridae sp.]
MPDTHRSIYLDTPQLKTSGINARPYIVAPIQGALIKIYHFGF